MSSNNNKNDIRRRPSLIPKRKVDIKTLLQEKSTKTDKLDKGNQAYQYTLSESKAKQKYQSIITDEDNLKNQKYQLPKDNIQNQPYQSSKVNKGKQPYQSSKVNNENQKEPDQETFYQLLERLKRDYLDPPPKKYVKEESNEKYPPILQLPPPTKEFYDSAFLEFVSDIVNRRSHLDTYVKQKNQVHAEKGTSNLEPKEHSPNPKENYVKTPSRQSSPKESYVSPKKPCIKENYVESSRRKSCIKDNYVEPSQRESCITESYVGTLRRKSSPKNYVKKLPIKLTTQKKSVKQPPKEPIVKDKYVKNSPTRESSPKERYVEKSRRQVNPQTREIESPINVLDVEEHLAEYNIDFDSIVIDDLIDETINQTPTSKQDMRKLSSLQRSRSSSYSWLCFDTDGEFIDFKNRFGKEFSNPFIEMNKSMKEHVSPPNSNEVNNNEKIQIAQEGRSSINIEKHIIGTSTPKDKDLSDTTVNSYKRKYDEIESNKLSPPIFKLPPRIGKSY